MGNVPQFENNTRVFKTAFPSASSRFNIHLESPVHRAALLYLTERIDSGKKVETTKKLKY